MLLNKIKNMEIVKIEDNSLYFKGTFMYVHKGI